MIRVSPRLFPFASVVLLSAICVGCSDKPDADISPYWGYIPGSAETWHAIYIGGKKAGYRFVIKLKNEEEDGVFKFDAVEELSVLRDGRPFKTVIKSDTEVSPGGVRRFTCRLEMGNETTVAEGIVVGDRLEYEKTINGKTESTTHDWPKGTAAYFGVERSLSTSPMQPGESRRIRVFRQPPLDSLGWVELQASEIEPKQIAGKTADLLRIDQVDELPGGAQLKSTIWCNPAGEILQSAVDALGITTFRTTKNIATADDGPPLDLVGADVAVVLDRPLDRPHQQSRVRYLVTLDGDDPAKVFPSSDSQLVTFTGPNQAKITLLRLRPSDRSNKTSRRKPPNAALKPNRLIDSDAPRIREMAESAAGHVSDPWQAAVGLEWVVHEAISEVNYSHALASATEVAASREGDCTEHAVLLAALCRARGIPARVAMGLVYVPAGNHFLYHMWTEVWIAGDWYGLDATLGLGGIGGGHLKLADSLLNDGTAYAGFLPVLEVVGRLKIEHIVSKGL